MEHVVEVQQIRVPIQIINLRFKWTPSSATNTTPTSAVCEGTDVTLAGTGTPTVEAGSGTISSGDYVTGNISSDEHQTVTIRYTVSANGACSGSTADQSFTVNAAPSSATNTTPTSAVCEGTDVTLQVGQVLQL